MTIREALTGMDALRQNSYTQEDKIAWLSQLDGKISLMILDAHEGRDIPFAGYEGDCSLDTRLLVDKPFDELYLYWLEAQICYRDGEIGDYNAAIAQYNRLYNAFLDAYRKQHMPRSGGKRFLF